jgi:hypothetical protein
MGATDQQRAETSSRFGSAALATMIGYTVRAMNLDRTIADIEWLERLLTKPDTRPLSESDISAANRKHDQKLARSPWFQLWQRFGICCRSEESSDF